jgi:hypothetical protein
MIIRKPYIRKLFSYAWVLIKIEISTFLGHYASTYLRNEIDRLSTVNLISSSTFSAHPDIKMRPPHGGRLISIPDKE